ncbi:Glyoxal reductase,related to aryl-alcohol dehydrogenases [Thermobacillus xylanilyticus]|jgi:diketogulonate reductase-like aldo/keto reductase|uniref:Glyoxal reductase,related to aryl-alcohol dehydrogenases n=1 Tax=Thermobacillus xylanilyticus TaxID=76633 RepID=A0ABN7RNY9_THEXY|nr:aldo/keto reductase [Thermobacillus xylanilyticus]REJ11894.1 MAG: aldo/keto reductase [Paenibacillaceae bacterium]CAG5079882.1 Glyoxal reductase,related to aryl-alcohol dehydrogenases [Thermobacillus xylanilyticus]
MEIRSIQDTTVLNNGVRMPWLGLGVFQVAEGEEVRNAVRWAIEEGYRSIDTAAGYRNETGVGQAIRESGVPREELFITTKLANSDQGYESTLRAFEESRRKLGVDYIDLYLIHWPGRDKYKETWRAFEKLYNEGYIRAIGVSNFQIHHLESLKETSGIIPAVNQVEFHPLLTQKELLDYCKREGIQLEAWSPIMKGNLDLPVLQELAAKYGKTPAQIVLRWDLELGVVTIPKSVRRERIAENADIFDFELSEEDIRAIDALNKNHRFGPHPDEFLF